MFLGLATILSALCGHKVHWFQCQSDKKDLEQCDLLSLKPPVEKKRNTENIEATCNSERPVGISKYSWESHDSQKSRRVYDEDEYFCVSLKIVLMRI